MTEASSTGPTLLSTLRAPLLLRSEWGAIEPVDWPVEHARVRALVIHHTATRLDEPDPLAMLRRVQVFHAQKRGWGDIGYSFVVLPDGRIAEGRFGSASAPSPTGVVAGHAYGHNTGTLGIAVAGQFGDGPPAETAWESLIDLLVTIVTSCGLDAAGGPVALDNGAVLPAVISGHRQVVATSCPGDALANALPQLRAQVAQEGASGRRRPASASAGEPVMPGVAVLPGVPRSS